MIFGSRDPPRFTIRSPSDVLVVDRLARKYRFGQSSSSDFCNFSTTGIGSGCFPTVKYIGKGIPILPSIKADTSVSFPSEEFTGPAKKSPRMIASENEFFE